MDLNQSVPELSTEKMEALTFCLATPTIAFPFLCAAQVKHHRNPNDNVGSPTVREFAGAIGGSRSMRDCLSPTLRFHPMPNGSLVSVQN